MKKFSFREKFLLYCSGVDIKTISECTSSEVNRYLVIGACVLIPTVLALFTGGYTIYLISKSVTISILFAPVWSWIIFTIDRAIVANTTTNKLTGNIKIRLLLALFISLLISHPVKLLIFRDVINEQRSVELERKIQKSTLREDSIINSRKQEISRLEGLLEKKNEEYRIEITKGNPQVGRPGGVGPVAKELAQLLAADVQKIENTKADISTELDSLNNKKRELISEAKRVDANGLIGELDMLYSIAFENWKVGVIIIFFILFFLIIELVPIVIKVDSNSKGEDLYNKIKSKNDEMCESAHEKMKQERERLFKKEQLLIISQRTQRIDLEIKSNGIKENAKNHNFFIQTIKATGDELEKVESEITMKIRNEIVREALLSQVLRNFHEFLKYLDDTIGTAYSNTEVDSDANQDNTGRY